MYLKSIRRLKDSTIRGRIKLLKQLARNVDLGDVEETLDYIQNSPWVEGRKANFIHAYNDYQMFNDRPTVKNPYGKELKIPYIPREEEIDTLISAFNTKYSALVQLAKETGFRIGEILRLKVGDFDLERETLTLNDPEKNSNPRQQRISKQLCAKIDKLIHGKSLGDRVWRGRQRDITRWFYMKRGQVAKQLCNPNIQRINFINLRHFKATMEYHRTKDILHVQRILGHRNIQNTLIYTHLVEWKDDEWIVKVADTLKEAMQLLEAGFEYVTDYQDKKLFRKRK